jgi:hypothetical protein
MPCESVPREYITKLGSMEGEKSGFKARSVANGSFAHFLLSAAPFLRPNHVLIEAA